MGAGGAYEVSPITRRMHQLTGQDFKRKNPVSAATLTIDEGANRNAASRSARLI